MNGVTYHNQRFLNWCLTSVVLGVLCLTSIWPICTYADNADVDNSIELQLTQMKKNIQGLAQQPISSHEHKDMSENFSLYFGMNLYGFYAKIDTPEQFISYPNIGSDTQIGTGTKTNGLAGEFAIGLTAYKYFFIGISYLKPTNYSASYKDTYSSSSYTHTYKYNSINSFVGINFLHFHSMYFRFRAGVSYVIINNTLDAVGDLNENDYTNTKLRPMYGFSWVYNFNKVAISLNYLSIVGDNTMNSAPSIYSTNNQVADSKIPSMYFFGAGMSYHF